MHTQHELMSCAYIGMHQVGDGEFAFKEGEVLWCSVQGIIDRDRSHGFYSFGWRIWRYNKEGKKETSKMNGRWFNM